MPAASDTWRGLATLALKWSQQGTAANKSPYKSIDHGGILASNASGLEGRPLGRNTGTLVQAGSEQNHVEGGV